MAFATVALAVSAITAVVGSGVAAYSNVRQGQLQDRMATANARIALRNAELTRMKGELAATQTQIVAKQHEKRTRLFLGGQRAAFGKAGVETESGTPLMIAKDTAAELELDRQAILFAGSVEESRIIAEQSGFKHEAVLSKIQGNDARATGEFRAGASLLTGLSQFAGTVANRPTRPKTTGAS